MNSLSGVFVLDDDINILSNKYIQIHSLTLDELGAVFSPYHPSSGRIIPNLTFALNYYLGGESPFGYHIVNIFIHIVNAWLVFLLVQWYFARIPLARHWNSLVLSGLAALLWATNPLQTSAVTYIVQRMTSLATLFCLASLVFYLRARTLGQTTSPPAQRTRLVVLYALLSFTSWILGLMSKEISVILPLVALAHEFYFFGMSAGFRQKKGRLCYLLSFLLLPLMLVVHYLGTDPFHSVLAGYELRDFTLVERLLTQPRVVFEYLSLFLYPSPDRLTLYRNDYLVSQGFFSPPSTFFAILGTLLWLAAIIFWYKRNRLLSLGMLWVFLTLLIESSLIPLELMFEHRFYFPSIGFVLALVSLFVHLFQWAGFRSFFLYALIALIIFLQGAGTIVRNQDWRSNVSFELDAVEKNPDSVRALTSLGYAYLLEKQPEKAVAVWQKALVRAPDDILLLGNIYLTVVQVPQLSKQDVDPLLTRIFDLIKSGGRASIQSQILYKLARFLHQQKQFEKSVILLKKVSMHDRSPDIVFNIGQCYLEMGDIDGALPYLEKAHSLEPENNMWSYYLALVYYDLGQADRAVRLMQELDALQTLDRKLRLLVREKLQLFTDRR